MGAFDWPKIEKEMPHLCLTWFLHHLIITAQGITLTCSLSDPDS